MTRRKREDEVVGGRSGRTKSPGSPGTRQEQFRH